MLPQVQMFAAGGRRRLTGVTACGVTKDEALAPLAWRAFGGDVEAFVGLSPRAQYALGRVEDEAREHVWETFRPRFVTALRRSRGQRPAYNEAGDRVRRGLPRLTFKADGSIYSSADRADERVSGEGQAWRLSDSVPVDPWLRIEAALDGESEAPEPEFAESRLVEMTPELRRLRAHIEQWLADGHLPQWRSWALRILILRGALGAGCCDDDPEGELDEATPPLPMKLRQLLDAVLAHMAEPAPKRSGRPKDWVARAKAGGFLSERTQAGLAREDTAAAATARLFAFCGVGCQRGSSAEQKRYARSAEAAEFAKVVAEAGDAAEAGDTSTAVEIWAARQRTLSGEPYTPAGTTRQRLQK